MKALGHTALQSLTVLTSCDGCGACCTHMGTPPGYAAFFPITGKISAVWKRCLDWPIFKSIPKPIKDGLRAYYEAVRAGKIPDRASNDATPCLWYDPETRKCRHYEYRPTICREFEIRSEGCLRHRKRVGIEP